MRLGITRNLISFKLSRLEQAQLYERGRVEQTVHFSLDGTSKIVYAIQHSDNSIKATLRYDPPEILIVVSTNELQRWITSETIGFCVEIDLGPSGVLQVLFEKDLECFDLFTSV